MIFRICIVFADCFLFLFTTYEYANVRSPSTHIKSKNVGKACRGACPMLVGVGVELVIVRVGLDIKAVRTAWVRAPGALYPRGTPEGRRPSPGGRTLIRVSIRVVVRGCLEMVPTWGIVIFRLHRTPVVVVVVSHCSSTRRSYIHTKYKLSRAPSSHAGCRIILFRVF